MSAPALDLAAIRAQAENARAAFYDERGRGVLTTDEVFALLAALDAREAEIAALRDVIAKWENEAIGCDAEQWSTNAALEAQSARILRACIADVQRALADRQRGEGA